MKEKINLFIGFYYHDDIDLWYDSFDFRNNTVSTNYNIKNSYIFSVLLNRPNGDSVIVSYIKVKELNLKM